MSYEDGIQKLSDLYTMDRGEHKYRGVDLPQSYLDQVLADFLVDLKPSDTVLDLGAGTCLIQSHLVKRGLKGIFIDISRVGLLHAKTENPDLEAVQAESLILPLAHQSVSAVHVKDILVHISDHQALIRELWRVLKPGGRIVLVSDEGHLDRSRHYYPVDQKKIEDSLVAAGFGDINSTSWIPERAEMEIDWYRRSFELTSKVVMRMVVFATKPDN